jgi:hypothetical protein
MTWSDALWGYERQLIGWTFIVEMACDRLCAGSNNAIEIELAGLTKSETHQTGDLLRALAAIDTTTPTETGKQKRLFILLAWVFENKPQFADPLGEVESIYADFDYPVEVEPFVRYMPPKDGCDATRHSADQNRERLFALWKECLDDAQRKFGIFSGKP